MLSIDIGSYCHHLIYPSEVWMGKTSKRGVKSSGKT